MLCRLIVVACSLMMTAAAFADGSSGIHVTGRGASEIEPDMARFTFEIVRQGSDAVALKREVDGATAAVIALAEKHGVARGDITAAVIQVRPEYRYVDGRSVLEGVVVSRTVRVELTNLTHYGALTNGAIAAGVNQINEVDLDVKDREALERAALERAIDHARTEGQYVARKLGMTLGRALQVTVDGAGGGPILFSAGFMKSRESDSFRPGTLTIERTVAVRFELVAQPPEMEPCDS